MEIMNHLSEQKQNEMLSFISTNYHNQMTARELMTEVLNAGFSDAEILFILHQADKNPTFKFKSESPRGNQRIQLEDVPDINGMTMTGFFRYVGTRFIDGEKHIVLMAYSDDDNAVFIVHDNDFPVEIRSAQ